MNTPVRKKDLPIPPVLVKLTGQPKLVQIPVDQLSHIKVGEYQRGTERGWIKQLAGVYARGGSNPCPIQVVKRANGDRYVVDGQQRLEAHKLLGLPILALTWNLEDLETERDLFVLLNWHKKIGASYVINAWSGEGGDLIRRLNAKVDSPLYQKIALGDHTGFRYTATSILRSFTTLLGNDERSSNGSTLDVLHALDLACKTTSRVEEKVAVFSDLVGKVFKEYRPPFMAMMALARVAKDKWAKKTPYMPTGLELSALVRINWDEVIPGFKWVYFDLAVKAVAKRWKS